MCHHSDKYSRVLCRRKRLIYLSQYRDHDDHTTLLYNRLLFIGVNDDNILLLQHVNRALNLILL